MKAMAIHFICILLSWIIRVLVAVGTSRYSECSVVTQWNTKENKQRKTSRINYIYEKKSKAINCATGSKHSKKIVWIDNFQNWGSKTSVKYGILAKDVWTHFTQMHLGGTGIKTTYYVTAEKWWRQNRLKQAHILYTYEALSAVAFRTHRTTNK